MDDAEPLVAQQVEACIAEANLPAIDRAAARLAVLYAHRIDAGEPLERFGPLLMRALDALLITPRSRLSAGKLQVSGGASDDEPDEQRDGLDELRQRRRTRAHRAATVDAAAP